MPPLVSVVTATYNRSNVLRHAIDSVLAQTCADWELIVVGDACTDDSGDVVQSYGDSRIRFVNLATNVGEQSGPNNEGVRLSRGRYLAFLNHDDIWLPAHLANLVNAIERTGADLVFSLISIIQPDGSRVLGGACASGRYEPLVNCNASSWLFRRSLSDTMGPWRHYRECFLAPSQDWLQRAHAAGRTLTLVPKLTVIAIPSSGRAGSYAERHHDEHDQIAEAVRANPEFVERELTTLALIHASRDPAVGASGAVKVYALRALKNIGRQFVMALGIPGAAARPVLRLRRGATIDQFRRTRGLPAKP